MRSRSSPKILSVRDVTVSHSVNVSQYTRSIHLPGSDSQLNTCPPSDHSPSIQILIGIHFSYSIRTTHPHTHLLDVVAPRSQQWQNPPNTNPGLDTIHPTQPQLHYAPTSNMLFNKEPRERAWTRSPHSGFFGSPPQAPPQYQSPRSSNTPPGSLFAAMCSSQ